MLELIKLDKFTEDIAIDDFDKILKVNLKITIYIMRKLLFRTYEI